MKRRNVHVTTNRPGGGGRDISHGTDPLNKPKHSFRFRMQRTVFVVVLFTVAAQNFRISSSGETFPNNNDETLGNYSGYVPQLGGWKDINETLQPGRKFKGITAEGDDGSPSHKERDSRKDMEEEIFFRGSNEYEDLNMNKSPLNDKTIPWSEDVDRLWLKPEGPEPPAMLLLTDLGWNQKNQTEGIELYRGWRLRELVEGIVNHPWFHPYAWRDINSGKMELSNTTRYYVFVDRDSCGEKNYPYYGHKIQDNRDWKYGRGVCCGPKPTGPRHAMADTILSSRVMSSPNSKFVIWDCHGWGPETLLKKAREVYREKVVFASVSAIEEQHIPGLDQGLPPPAVNPCNLTVSQRNDIMICNEESRRIKLSFAGNMVQSQARLDLFTIHNNKDVLIGISRNILRWVQGASSKTEAFRILASTSLFGAAPLGDNVFSYRFSEIMSCGAIPVVYADGWVFPFSHDLIPWREAVVIIPERRANESLQILDAFSAEKRCRMRRRALELYETYMSDGRKTVAGLIQGLELATNRPTTLTGPINQATLPGCKNEAAIERLSNATKLPKKSFDRTLCWRDVDRLWLNETSRPPSMVLTTNFGWNKKNKGLRYYRSLRTRELMQGVVNHPWYHHGGWEGIVHGSMSVSKDIKYYIFLDMETCQDTNYPHMGRGRQANADTIGGRSSDGRGYNDKHLDRVWRRLAGLNFRLVFLDCGPSGPPERIINDRHLVVASVSARKNQLLSGVDQGLPPPTFRVYFMSKQQREDLDQCRDEETRDILLSFSGNLLSLVRQDLKELHNGKDILIGTPNEMAQALNTSDPYWILAKRSLFAAVPKGLTLGTSRLVEMMSAGAIPVSLANDWVLPLSAVVDWTEIAILVDEYDVGKVVPILRSISKEDRCKMRKKVVQVYDEYFSSPEGNIRGIIEGLELDVSGSITPPSGDLGIERNETETDQDGET